ncbi:MAG: phosphatase PAP2 family protein [Patescibacteria group bacterium]|jgi:undecaprenyl-diphosphatase
MQNLFDAIRHYDFTLYLYFHRANLNYPALGLLFYFFAAYGVIISVLSTIYLIWQRRINALIGAALATGVALITDIIISIFWSRPRPFISHPELVFPENVNISIHTSSFSSSHTYIAFAIATAIFLYGHKKLGVFLFAVAILVAISRIGVGLHYPSDVIGGALLGIASGIFSFLFVHKSQKYWKLEDVS